jgi:hypothetical protein
MAAICAAMCASVARGVEAHAVAEKVARQRLDRLQREIILQPAPGGGKECLEDGRIVITDGPVSQRKPSCVTWLILPPTCAPCSTHRHAAPGRRQADRRAQPADPCADDDDRL